MHRLISTVHLNLGIPITAKIRVFETIEKTVAYAKMVVGAGAQVLTVHGRFRMQKGSLSVLLFLLSLMLDVLFLGVG